MPKRLGVPGEARAAGAAAPSVRTCALELVALRGRDVVGVRHVVAGERAWVGDVGESLLRLPARDLEGGPFVVGEVAGDRFVLHVPPRARARASGADGLGRLFVGPARVPLGPGDRAVLVLGRVQIRARVVPLSALGRRATSSWVATVARTLAAVLVVYALVLAASALVAPPLPARATLGAAWAAVERARGVADLVRDREVRRGLVLPGGAP